MIANLVIIMMLLVSVSSSAFASTASKVSDGCSSLTILSCCSAVAAPASLERHSQSEPLAKSDNTPQGANDACGQLSTEPSASCCQDSQCHSSQVLLAILGDEFLLQPQQASHHYTEFEGKHLFIGRVIFRPPVTV
jgi:hypothetical protein